jgi:Na+-transporting NADH:ubiquinone oxidoreductase subunit F
MLEILLGVVFFTVIVIALVFIIIGAKSKLVASGDIEILINDEKKIHVPAGSKLLMALADNELFIPSACGGGHVDNVKLKLIQGVVKFYRLSYPTLLKEKPQKASVFVVKSRLNMT